MHCVNCILFCFKSFCFQASCFILVSFQCCNSSWIFHMTLCNPITYCKTIYARVYLKNRHFSIFWRISRQLLVQKILGILQLLLEIVTRHGLCATLSLPALFLSNWDGTTLLGADQDYPDYFATRIEIGLNAAGFQQTSHLNFINDLISVKIFSSSLCLQI